MELSIAIVLTMIGLMKNLIRHTVLIVGLLAFTGLKAAPCDKTPTEPTKTQEKSPGDYLEFYSVLDGKCQILSNCGKLRLVKNNHPDKAIKYRFNRIFAGKRQASMTIGVLEPGGKPVKLGCTKVDGREQTWEISVAKFVE